MDITPKSLSKGILHDLQLIEEESAKQKLQQDREKVELTRLLKKRDILRQKLADRRKVLASFSSSEEDVTSIADSTSLNDALWVQKNKLEELKLAYRLTGTSVSIVNQSTVRLCFDTSYRGEFYEPYYVELDIGKDGLAVKRHTLPVFISIVDAADTYLNSDIKTFTRTTADRLNAFVARRQELEKVKRILADHLNEEIQASSSLDHIEITLKGTDSVQDPLKVILLYTDAADLFPSEVNISLCDVDNHKPEELREVTEVYTNLLKSKELTTALLDVITR